MVEYLHVLGPCLLVLLGVEHLHLEVLLVHMLDVSLIFDLRLDGRFPLGFGKDLTPIEVLQEGMFFDGLDASLLRRAQTLIRVFL